MARFVVAVAALCAVGVCLAVSGASAARKIGAHKADGVHLDDGVARLMFDQFMKQYARSYASASAFDRAFANFKTNVKQLVHDRESGRLGAAVELGITKFFDESRESMHAHKCGGTLSGRIATKPQPKPTLMPDMTRALPSSWNWTAKGAVTPVQNQEQCGSCWAFSSVGALEGSLFLAQNKLVKMSEQEFVDCSASNYGCGGGWPFMAYSDILQQTEKGGVDTETAYPYAAVNQACAYASSGVGATYVNYQSYCNEQTNACTEAQMQQLLVQYGPLSICLNAEPFQSYSGGVLNPQDCDPSQIDHCVTLTGYGTDPVGGDYWLIKNSWSTSWGENGYVRLARNVAGQTEGVCGVARVVTLPQFSS